MARRMNRMLALIALLLAMTISIAGCDILFGLFEPLIGTWKGTWTESSSGRVSNDTLEFTWKGAFTDTVELQPAIVVTSGTYMVDHAARMITGTCTSSSDPAGMPVGSVWTMSYSLGADDDTLTLAATYGTGLYRRQ